MGQYWPIHLRKSSNGRKAVSKTVNVGSIPAFRAKLLEANQCYRLASSPKRERSYMLLK